MFSKLAQAAFALTSIAQAEYSRQDSVQKLIKGDTPQEALKDYDFSVISFFRPTDLDSVEVDSFFEGA